MRAKSSVFALGILDQSACPAAVLFSFDMILD